MHPLSARLNVGELETLEKAIRWDYIEAEPGALFGVLGVVAGSILKAFLGVPGAFELKP